MESYKEEFIDFMVEADVLRFGSFTLKSGRQSPFFMNAGAYVTGGHLSRLGDYYAQAIHARYGLDFDVLFGPAYKGIPLADGDRVVIIEDVTTSGASIAETYPVLQAQAKVSVVGLMVSLNREEKGATTEQSALREIEETYGFPASAIVSMHEVTERLHNRRVGDKIVIDDAQMEAIRAYYEIYGAQDPDRA